MLSINCQYTVNILSICCQYTVSILSTYHQYTVNMAVNILSIYYQYAVNKLSICCQYTVDIQKGTAMAHMQDHTKRKHIKYINTNDYRESILAFSLHQKGVAAMCAMCDVTVVLFYVTVVLFYVTIVLETTLRSPYCGSISGPCAPPQ